MTKRDALIRLLEHYETVVKHSVRRVYIRPFSISDRLEIYSLTPQRRRFWSK